MWFAKIWTIFTSLAQGILAWGLLSVITLDIRMMVGWEKIPPFQFDGRIFVTISYLNIKKNFLVKHQDLEFCLKRFLTKYSILLVDSILSWVSSWVNFRSFCLSKILSISSELWTLSVHISSLSFYGLSSLKGNHFSLNLVICALSPFFPI
jgi:hypothetical protein